LDLNLLEDAKRDAQYPAELRERIPAGRPCDQVTEAQRRMALLFDFLGIAPGDFQELAIALACRQIVGFGVAKKRGRPRKKRVPLTAAQIAQKLGASGRGRRMPEIPADALVSSVDKWLDEQRRRTGRRPRDADWARFAAGEDADKQDLLGWRRDKFVRDRTAVRKTQISQARKKTKWAAPVKKRPRNSG
jgi:hypothetical protein